MSNGIEETIKERAKDYGSYEDFCTISSALKDIIKEHSGNKLKMIHEETLDMIMVKVARILNGDPDYIDNWHDIAGYASLVEKCLKEKK